MINSQQLQNLVTWIQDSQDDEFYHITSHVDVKLKQKISKGEYIDLEMLFPKSRFHVAKEDDRLQQYVTKNGMTYWGHPEREAKITNIRKWEQAFCIYAAIYCQANPHRSGEIWQYMHTINNASISFAWENIMYYDVTFRQMMGEKPLRSWGKIYSQLWHVAMCDPLLKTGTHQPSQPNAKQGDWRDRCCWHFNRNGKCKKWNCAFDHRCTVCGAYNHHAKICNKQKNPTMITSIRAE